MGNSKEENPYHQIFVEKLENLRVLMEMKFEQSSSGSRDIFNRLDSFDLRIKKNTDFINNQKAIKKRDKMWIGIMLAIFSFIVPTIQFFVQQLFVRFFQ